MKQPYGVILLGLFLLFGMVAFPAQCMNAASEGLLLSARVLIPSLFPFYVCSKLLLKSGFAQWVGSRMQRVMKPLFGVPGCGAFAFVMGILSGYPVGAKCAVDLYSTGQCTKTEAERMVAFCNNSGPLFLLGVVGSGLLGQVQLGVLLYVSHVLSALLVGMLFRFYRPAQSSCRPSSKPKPQALQSAPTMLSEAITEAVSLVFYVCGFVVLFGVLLELGSILVLHRLSPLAAALCYGGFELVNGVSRLCALPLGDNTLLLVSAVIAWGGVGVMLQVFGMTGPYGLSKRSFVAAKAMQSAISAGMTWLLLKLPLTSAPTVAPLQTAFENSLLWQDSVFLLAIGVVVCVVLSMAAAKGNNC